MKKVTINFLGIMLFTTILFSCGGSTDGNTEADNNEESYEKEESYDDEETGGETSYNKFEQYATILTKADLMAIFGEENIKTSTEAYAEGTVEKEVSTLINPENGQVIRYIWGDDNSTEWIEALYNIYDENYEIISTQNIEAENGLSTGMGLMDLKAWNGADFKFSGFGWDYAGTIYTEEGSKMQKSTIQISLDNLTIEGADFTLGDVELNTSDERLLSVEIIVSSLTMYIN